MSNYLNQLNISPRLNLYLLRDFTCHTIIICLLWKWNDGLVSTQRPNACMVPSWGHFAACGCELSALCAIQSNWPYNIFGCRFHKRLSTEGLIVGTGLLGKRDHTTISNYIIIKMAQLGIMHSTFIVRSSAAECLHFLLFWYRVNL